MTFISKHYQLPVNKATNNAAMNYNPSTPNSFTPSSDITKTRLNLFENLFGSNDESSFVEGKVSTDIKEMIENMSAQERETLIQDATPDQLKKLRNIEFKTSPCPFHNALIEEYGSKALDENGAFSIGMFEAISKALGVPSHVIKPIATIAQPNPMTTLFSTTFKPNELYKGFLRSHLKHNVRTDLIKGGRFSQEAFDRLVWPKLAENPDLKEFAYKTSIDDNFIQRHENTLKSIHFTTEDTKKILKRNVKLSGSKGLKALIGKSISKVEVNDLLIELLGEKKINPIDVYNLYKYDQLPKNIKEKIKNANVFPTI